MFNQYPYINLNDLNLDYILKAIKEMRYEVTNFVSINAIKYADPIQWNITSQYEKNTIVIDPQTGTAYISVAPVPAGVALTRPEYWTVVFDLGSFVTRAAKNFTTRYEQDTTLTATFPTTAGEWLVWGDTLYVANTNITAGDSYVVDGNIKRITVEEVKDAILQLIADNYNTLVAMIGDLDDLTTTAKNNIVAAINELVTADSSLSDRIGDEEQARQDADDAINTTIGDLDDLATSDKSSVVNAINEAITSGLSVTPEQFGAIGDGVTDDTTAFQNAIDYAITNKCSVVATKRYNVANLNINATSVDGLTMIFNTLTGNSASPILTIEGQSITLIGNMIRNDNGDALQCGGSNAGLAGATVNITFLRSALGNCLVLKAHPNQNIQDVVFNISRMVYKLHAVKMDTTDRYVGEITFNGTWFNAVDMDDNAYAIWCDCAQHGMTGLYLNSCSFEGAGNGIQVLNTSIADGGIHQFMPLFGFGLRVSEFTEMYDKTLLDYHGTGRLIGSLFVDSLPLDKIVIHDSLANQLAASKLSIFGRVRIRRGEAVFSNSAILGVDSMAINVADDGLSVINPSPITYTDSIPATAHIRNQSTITFSFSTLRFAGEVWIMCDNVANTVTVNGTTFTPTVAGEVIKVSCVYILGVGYRYLVEQGGKITIKNPM